MAEVRVCLEIIVDEEVAMKQETERLEQFRQLRKEIRGAQNFLVVGVDISKDSEIAPRRRGRRRVKR